MSQTSSMSTASSISALSELRAPVLLDQLSNDSCVEIVRVRRLVREQELWNRAIHLGPEPPVCGVSEEADLRLVDHAVRNQTARHLLHDVLCGAPLHFQIRWDPCAELHDLVIQERDSHLERVSHGHVVEVVEKRVDERQSTVEVHRSRERLVDESVRIRGDGLQCDAIIRAGQRADEQCVTQPRIERGRSLRGAAPRGLGRRAFAQVV